MCVGPQGTVWHNVKALLERLQGPGCFVFISPGIRRQERRCTTQVAHTLFLVVVGSARELPRSSEVLKLHAALPLSNFLTPSSATQQTCVRWVNCFRE